MAGEEKTEKATPKKRKDQRKEGNVLQSKEIGIAASVLGIFAAMRLLLGFISENIFSYTGSVFEELGSTYVTTDNIMTIWVDVITVFGITVGPVCLIAIFLGIIPTIAQTRGLFTMKALKPKFSRLNPLSGIKKLFSLQSIVGILKGLIEVIIISVVIYNEIRGRGWPIDVGNIHHCVHNAEGQQQRVTLEVDFVCNKGSERIYIQSAWRMPDGEKMEQAKRSLRLVGDSFRKLLVVGEHTKSWNDESGIQTMSIYDFLLDMASTERL